MASGETTLSISDIPFSYTIINLAFILYNGKISPIDGFYPLLMLSGIVGAFLVTVHPIQRLIDFKIRRNIKNNVYADYEAKYDHSNGSPTKIVSISKIYLKLSLNTSSIKHELNKQTSIFYFILILLGIFYAITQPSFQEILGIEVFGFYFYLFEILVLSMICIITTVLVLDVMKFHTRLRITALFFQCSNRFPIVPELIKTSIDQNDWSSAKELLHTFLKSNWGKI